MSVIAPPEPPAAGSDPPAPAKRSRAWLWFVLVGVLALVASVVGVVVASGGSDGPTATVTKTYVIKKGTRGMVLAGIKMQGMPTQIPMRVGDTLVVVNQDTFDHEFGVLTVRAGETATYSFPRAGTYRGACTTDPGGELTIKVYE